MITLWKVIATIKQTGGQYVPHKPVTQRGRFTMPKIDKNIVMLLTSETSPSYSVHDPGAIRLYATTVVQNNGIVQYHDDGRILNPSLTGSTWGEQYAHLSNLRAAALSNLDEPDKTFGWKIEYGEHHFIRLEEAETMVKALRKITRDMEKLAESLGQPQSFGEYVTHFGLAIGCNRWAQHVDEMRYDGTHYKWYDVDGMRRWIYNTHAPQKQVA